MTVKFNPAKARITSLLGRVIMISWILACGAIASAQGTPAPEISILTCHAGPEIYELCGHTAIRINRPGVSDYVVNYGLFDFNSPNFVYRFVKGETDYMVGAHPTDMFLESYRRQGRTVEESLLNLTPEQAIELERLLLDNMKPENRQYRYNYVKDNCATRPLAMIERAIGAPLQLAGDDQPTTFRNEMRRYHANYPWYQFGIDLALGSGIDYPISQHEKAFAPIALGRMLDRAVLTDSLGNTIPALSAHRIVVEGNPSGAVQPPTPWYLRPVTIFWLLFALALSLNVRDIVKRSPSRWFDTIYFSACGVAGILVAFLVIISTHEATSPNWLLLWLNPLCFCGAVLPWIKSMRNVLYWYHFANFAVLILLLVCRPLTGQEFNPAFWPLILTGIARSDNYILLTKLRKWAIARTQK